MVSLKLYYLPMSPPSRFVILTAKAIKLNLELKLINLFKKQHLSKDYVKINPQHTVPTLDDNGFYLYESRAIATYLVDKYSKDDDSLYPKDIKKRAHVNQRLYFDATTISSSFRNIYYPIFIGEENAISEQKINHLNAGLQILNQHLNRNQYLCGENLTLADISTVTSISTLKEMEWNLSYYDNINIWLEKCSKTLPGYSDNVEGAKAFAAIIKKLTNQ